MQGFVHISPSSANLESRAHCGARRNHALLALVALAAAVLLAAGAEAQQDPQQFDAAFQATATITVDPERCPNLTANVEGGGLSRLFGQFTTVQQHCIDPTGPDPLAFTDGFYTFTNTNGDQISGTYAGQLVPTATSDADGVFLNDAAFTITGGTGDFAGAFGGGGAGGLLHIDPAVPAQVTLDGEIRFHGR